MASFVPGTFGSAQPCQQASSPSLSASAPPLLWSMSGLESVRRRIPRHLMPDVLGVASLLAGVLAAVAPGRRRRRRRRSVSCAAARPRQGLFGQLSTGFGTAAAVSQWYLFGKRNFTSTGWERHKQEYEAPDLLETNPDLSGRVFLVTGANSGIGLEVTRFLASKGASVYMVCRNRERGEQALAGLVQAGSNRVRLLVGDMGLEADVRRLWDEFCAVQQSEGVLRLDGMVCNAGSLSNDCVLTRDGVESTFATHLLCGAYLLGTLALPLLEATPGGRLIAVSSGGMYVTGFPEWSVATSAGDPSSYNGQLAYAYAKRGQVLLCERWAEEHPSATIVSCHPGWTSTPGVDAAYGEAQRFLSPLRSTWQGAEGIAWLCIAPSASIETGAFYLDRLPQPKHLAGPLFTEGYATQNSREEVTEMMRGLCDTLSQA